MSAATPATTAQRGPINPNERHPDAVDQRLCVDCAHAHPDPTGNDLRCCHPVNGFDLITGKPVLKLCYMAREPGLTKEEKVCGPEGAWFAQIEIQDSKATPVPVTTAPSIENDSVCGKYFQALAVGIPGGSAFGGHTAFPVEIYTLGRGVSAVGQRGHLLGREGTLELEAPCMYLVFDPLACQRVDGFVVPVKGNIKTILQALKAKHQAGVKEFLFTRCSHDVAPQKAVILQLPAAMGKSTVGDALCAWLKCTHVVDFWEPSQPLTPGALHLTRTCMVLKGGAA